MTSAFRTFALPRTRDATESKTATRCLAKPLLTFTQNYTKELSDVAYGTYNYNWGYYLESLKQYCETGTGKPYQPAT